MAVVKVTEPIVSIFGYLGDGEKGFVSGVFEELGVSKEQRFSVDLEPMSDEDCIAIDTLNRQESSQEMMLRIQYPKLAESNDKVMAYTPKSKKKDIPSQFDVDNCIKLGVKRKECNKNTQKFEIAQKYVSNLSGEYEFSGKGVVDSKAWKVMHVKLKKSFYDKIYEMSNLNQDDIINLQ